jgi:hypothetical protein
LTAYDPAEWSDLFVATAGAVGAVINAWVLLVEILR